MTAPALPGLAPRAVDVRIADLRPVPEQDRRATEQHLTDVLARVLAPRGVTVDAAANARWFVTVQQPLSESDAIDPGTCIEVQSELSIRGVHSPAHRTIRCSQWRQGGGSFGSGVLAFEGAVDAVLQRLDHQLHAVLQRFAPPTFYAGRIDPPRFGWLMPREMGFAVRDELSADGASGRSLERALEDALARSGIRRVPEADYRLEWVLRRPAQVGRGTANACVELSVNARHRRHLFHPPISGTCTGWNERLVTELLRELNADGEERRQRQRPTLPAQPAPLPT